MDDPGPADVRVLVVASDHVGSQMAGPGIRSHRFAVELAKRFDVTLCVPYETDIEPQGFELVVANPYSSQAMTRLARRFDAVVSQRLPFPTLRALAGSRTRMVFDLYAPWTIENLAFDQGRTLTRTERAYFGLNVFAQEAMLRYGDAFICASERQRDLWIGSLLALGRVDHAAFADDPSLRALVGVVPFGIELEPPKAGRAMRGVVPGIDDRAEILLWPGAVWNWFDPLTVIRAVAELRRDRENLWLVFLGTKHPNPGVPEMEMTSRAIELTEELGLSGRGVHFNNAWVPYAERGAWLLEADLGVSAHFDDLETRFAYRTRLLDCFWAGLPVVATEGDTLASLIRERGVGLTVAPGDIAGWKAAVVSLLDDDAARRQARTELERVRAELAWPRVVEPLVALLEQPTRRRARAGSSTAAYVARRLDFAIASRGVLGSLRRVGRLAAAQAGRRLEAVRPRPRRLPSTPDADE